MRHGIVAAAALSSIMSFAALAQSYPVKAVRVVVPFPPGGGSDVLIRPMQPRLTEALGQPIVIDNRPGANANIGAEHVARAAPDGYTLLFGNSSLAINETLYTKLSFSALKDFTPISLVSVSPSVLVVHPSLPVKSVKELIALARQRPGKLNFASGGAGNTMHLAAEQLKAMANIDMVHVPYKGAGPAITDVIGGQCELVFVNIPPVLGHIQSGKLNALAVTTKKRASVLPNVPTVHESGLPGYESTTWYGVLGPAALSRDIVSRLNAAVVSTIAAPDVRQRLVSLGSEPETNTPEQFAAFIRRDIADWARVVKYSGAKLE